MSSDPRERFTDRVENYARYRPSYPPEILQLLAAECGLTPESVVADIGSGTGIMTKLFLENGNRVFAVEPNQAMREAAEKFLSAYPSAVSVSAEAEATSLDSESCDFVVAAQAFHWFDRYRARTEFLRILKPEGWVVLVWNTRQDEATPFMAAYEQLVRDYSADYSETNHRRVTEEVLRAFFARDEFESRTLYYNQALDFAAAKGRLLSSSYAPLPGTAEYEPMLQSLRSLFDAHQADGMVQMAYQTEVYFGHLHERHDPSYSGLPLT